MKRKDLSPVHSHQSLSLGNLKQIAMDLSDCMDAAELKRLGIDIGDLRVLTEQFNYAMDATDGNPQAWATVFDDQQGFITTPSIPTPVQFLQTWLPGFIRTVTAVRAIDDIIGITTVGNWEDEEIVQGVLEPSGSAVPYGDLTNIPLSDWNVNFERRTVVRMEQGFRVGRLEEDRAARVRVSSSAEKRSAAALALEIARNLIGFNGFNGGNNRTYGLLNDPNLPAYYTVANGASASPLWANKTTLEIIADIQQILALLQTKSQGVIDPAKTSITLVLPTNQAQRLNTPTQFGYSINAWLRDNYPNLRIVTAPQLNAANGGANVMYAFADSVDDGASDGSQTWIQAVPARFLTLGVEKKAKAYVEDFSNATAGAFLKRPWAVARASGI